MQRSLRAALAIALVTFLAPSASYAAQISLDPSSGSFGPGDTFIAAVRVMTDAGECINAAHVEISYPSDRMRVIDFGRGRSIFSLWPEEPKIDAEKGLITFSGGVPGGYCGRIQGDPEQTNVLGDIAFTILKTDAKQADVTLLPASTAYLNNGLGTKAPLSLVSASFGLVDKPTLKENEWLSEVQNDTKSPEPFTVQVQSTAGVFGGSYYAVFSTVDKQSGIDHYEIFENGFWKTVTSPHILADQLIINGVQVKAVDKAGNEQLGLYDASSTPHRALSRDDFITLGAILVIFALMLGVKWVLDRRRKPEASDAQS